MFPCFRDISAAGDRHMMIEETFQLSKYARLCSHLIAGAQVNDSGDAVVQQKVNICVGKADRSITSYVTHATGGQKSGVQCGVQ